MFEELFIPTVFLCQECKHMSQTRRQRKAIAFWAKTLDGQFHKKQQIKKIKCPKCFETFRNDSGLKSHLFHRHTVEGRNRYPKKPKTKKKLVTRSLTKQRQVASRKPRKRYSLEENESSLNHTMHAFLALNGRSKME